MARNDSSFVPVMLLIALVLAAAGFAGKDVINDMIGFAGKGSATTACTGDACINPKTETSLANYYCEGGVVDIIKSDETKSYSIDGWDYQLTTTLDENTNTAKLNLNGVASNALAAGESDSLGGGLIIQVFEVTGNTATFCLKHEFYPVCDDTDPYTKYQNPAITSFGLLSKQDYCIDNTKIMNYYCSNGIIKKNENFYTTVNKNEIHFQYIGYSASNKVATFINMKTGIGIQVNIQPDGNGELVMQGIPLQFMIQNPELTDSDIGKTINFKAIVGHDANCQNGCQNNACT